MTDGLLGPKRNLSKAKRMANLRNDMDDVFDLLRDTFHKLSEFFPTPTHVGIDLGNSERQVAQFILQRYEIAPHKNLIFVPAGRQITSGTVSRFHLTWPGFKGDVHEWAETFAPRARLMSTILHDLTVAVDYLSYMNRDGNSHARYLRGTPITEKDCNRVMQEAGKHLHRFHQLTANGVNYHERND